MPDTSFRSEDSVRILLRQMLHETGLNPQTRIEVEDPEIAVELVGLGLADSVVPKGAAEQLLPRLAPERRRGSHSGRSSTTHFAIVHRAGATLSPAAQLMIELATRRIRRGRGRRSAGEPVLRDGAVDEVALDGRVDAVVAGVVAGVPVSVAPDQHPRGELRRRGARTRPSASPGHGWCRRRRSARHPRLPDHGGCSLARSWKPAQPSRRPGEHVTEGRRGLLELGDRGRHLCRP